jgi:NAD(P)-dependent dehydrogenase (short-subunit alcohol dehydrogenase family)
VHIDLTGRRALITAGAAGIGRAIAERFASSGAEVVVCDVDEAALAEVGTSNAGILAVRTDVSAPRDVARLFDAIEGAFGGLDILVNNAGISGPTKPVDEITPEEWSRTMEVNVTGAFLCASHAARFFKPQRYGVILNMSSSAGRLGMPLRSPYSASKYAVRGLTDALAVELGEYGIRVNAILPGLVDGPRGRRVIGEQAAAVGMSYEDYLPFLLHNISMHEAVSMDDVAAMATFLASDLAGHISGQSIGVCANFESYRAPKMATA